MSKTQIYRSLAALLGIIGVTLQIHQDGWGMLLYYTVLSNILVFSFLIYLVIYESRHGSINGNPRLLRTKGGVTMSIMITFMVYHFLLSPYVTHEAYWNVRNFLVHYIAPLLFIGDTLFLDRKKSYRWFDPLTWTALPLLYLAFAIFNGVVTRWAVPGSPDSPFAYYFMNFPKYGVTTVALNCLVIFIAYILIGYLLLLLKRFLGNSRA